MRNFDEMNVDITPKWDVSSKLNHRLLTVACLLDWQRKKGIDVTNFNNVKQLRVFNAPLKFTDYCDVICDFDSYVKENARIQREKFKRFQIIGPTKSMTKYRYFTPYTYEIIERVNNSKNPYQTFFDELYYQDFKIYVEWQLSDLKSPFTSKKLKLIKIKEQNNFLQFRNTYDLIGILLNNFLTKKEKIKIVNIQHTLFYKTPNNETMLKSILDKNSLISINQSEQAILYNKWEEMNKGKGRKSLKKFKRNIII